MQENIPIVILIISGTMLFILLVVIIIISLLFYQKSKNKHTLEIKELENNYQREILTAQLEVKEQTMHGIGQEIHDNIGQILSLAKLNVNQLIKQKPEEQLNKLNGLKDLIQKAIVDLRNVSKELNSDFISHKTLAELILQEEKKLLQSDYQVSSEVHGSPVLLDPKVQLIAYRIIQEVINNSVKHARAGHIALKCHFLTHKVVISIADDGIGFDMKQNVSEDGTGLFNLHERAKLIHGDFSLKSQLNEGTKAQLEIPIHQPTSYE